MRFAIRVPHTNTLTGSATREPDPRKGPLNAYAPSPSPERRGEPEGA